jgi:hypothetical protein
MKSLADLAFAIYVRGHFIIHAMLTALGFPCV